MCFSVLTPTRPEMQRQGMVIVQMKCFRDKQEVLKRKPLMNNLSVYRNMLIKASKTYVWHVMDADFNVMDADFIVKDREMDSHIITSLSLWCGHKAVFMLVLVVITGLELSDIGSKTAHTTITENIMMVYRIP